METSLFSHRDYKTLIRQRLKEKRAANRAFTTARLAEKLNVQAAYLSRVLNSEVAHFSEDQLYRILVALDLPPALRDFGLLLRAFRTTTLADRRRDLEQRIQLYEETRGAPELPVLREEVRRVLTILERVLEL